MSAQLGRWGRTEELLPQFAERGFAEFWQCGKTGFNRVRHNTSSPTLTLPWRKQSSEILGMRLSPTGAWMAYFCNVLRNFTLIGTITGGSLPSSYVRVAPAVHHMGAFRSAVDLVVARETGKGDSAICASAAFEVGVAQQVQVSCGDQHLQPVMVSTTAKAPPRLHSTCMGNSFILAVCKANNSF